MYVYVVYHLLVGCWAIQFSPHSVQLFPHTLSNFPSDFPPTLSVSDSGSIPTSFSTDVLLTPEGYQRPLSIFSPIRLSASMMDTSLDDEESESVVTLMTETRAVAKAAAAAAQTLPKPRRPLSQEVRERKMTVGVAHFNR